MQVLQDFVGIEIVGGSLEYGETYPLAQPVICDRECRSFGDVCVSMREIFNTRGMDIVSTANNEILLASNDLQTSLIV
jgi:hypothetical protein